MIKAEARRERQHGPVNVLDGYCLTIHPMSVARGDTAILFAHAFAGLMIEKGNALSLHLGEAAERAWRVDDIIALIEVDAVWLIHFQHSEQVRTWRRSAETRPATERFAPADLRRRAADNRCRLRNLR